MVSLLEAHSRGALLATPQLIISNQKDAPGLERAEAFSVRREWIPWKKAEEAEERALEILEEERIDFVVLAGFMRVLKYSVLDHYSMAIINIHPSLLPSFPGLESQRQALEYGIRYTGCTTHLVTADVDRGPVILQQVVEVLPDDTEESLSKRILAWEHKILSETVNLFASESLEVLEGKRVKIHWDRYRAFCLKEKTREEQS